jgi:Tfp pilus assembly protein PilV
VIGALEVYSPRADYEGVIVRLRGEKGFGLIELLTSMVVLNVGILAMVAAFNSGAVALRHASHVSTAAALGDQQMELYRALMNACIYLNSPPSTGTYASDTAYTPPFVTSPGSCATTPDVKATTPSQTISGASSPDHNPYEVDTYIVYDTPTGGRQLKKVTVVVRDGNTLRALARVSSTFDASTGE